MKYKPIAIVFCVPVIIGICYWYYGIQSDESGRVYAEEKSKMKRMIANGSDESGNISISASERYKLVGKSMNNIAEKSTDEMKGFINAVMTVVLPINRLDSQIEVLYAKVNSDEFYDVKSIIGSRTINDRLSVLEEMKKASIQKANLWKSLRHDLTLEIGKLKASPESKDEFVSGAMRKFDTRNDLILRCGELHVQYCDIGHAYLKTIESYTGKIASGDTTNIAGDLAPLAQKMDLIIDEIQSISAKMVRLLKESP